ncbi:hypothetical protein [Nocardioides sp. LS1]|uniref:hypothetical protein n=1 Tax=Nocardioides sp. LS1 TaxID=1027620 RepID=UPI000F61CABA|nr:hypothetical protein [Nocardioides sp. LS1]GCD92117.1 hypothetical protein NLS1_41230 [Nocardioides sp. LS1]
MTYTWHAVDGRLVELCDECGFDARDLTDGRDETERLITAYADLERLLTHPDADRRPEPETWSAREYVDHCVEVCGAAEPQRLSDRCSWGPRRSSGRRGGGSRSARRR